MKHDEQDELWDLLGKAKEPKTPAFFAGKVMRAIQQEPQRASLWMWLRQKWVFSVAMTACAVVVGVISMQSAAPRSQTQAVKVAVSDPFAQMAAAASRDELDEFDASLNTLLAAEDHSVWLSADPSSLY